jgi:hypothetical protein
MFELFLKRSSMTKAFSEEKRQEWKQLIEQWETADQKMSMARWCSDRNISYNSFLYWKEQFRSGAIRKVNRASFQELTHSQPVSTGIVLECDQIRIQLAENFDAATLKKCLRVLKEAVC